LKGVPGLGVLITQAKHAVPGTSRFGEGMLLNGTYPAVIIETTTDPLVDDSVITYLKCDKSKYVTYEEYKVRRYGSVDLMGRAAGDEDPDLKEFYYDYCLVEGEGERQLFKYTQEHKTGVAGTYTYSIQSNIVTDTTVPAMESNFVGQDENVGCDLADRLYRSISPIPLMLKEALETGDKAHVAGDVRCFEISAWRLPCSCISIIPMGPHWFMLILLAISILFQHSKCGTSPIGPTIHDQEMHAVALR
jgi:hypothetical protein